MNQAHIKGRLRLFLLMPVLVVAVVGCAHYELKHTFTTTNTIGTQTVELCHLSILSMREIKAGDIKISKGCALSGSGEKLGVNEKMLELMSETVTLMSDAVKKVP